MHIIWREIQSCNEDESAPEINSRIFSHSSIAKKQCWNKLIENIIDADFNSEAENENVHQMQNFGFCILSIASKIVKIDRLRFASHASESEL